jgi:predicted nucleic acid-binding protein
VTGLNPLQRKTVLKIVIDSYAWIEHFHGSVNSGKVREILESADILYTPDIVLAEIARKYIREGVEDYIVKARLEQISANSTITYLNSHLAIESAKCYLELRENTKKNKLNTPSFADAIILATGRALNARVLTGDEHFKALPETMWV